jgi:hypothetical protein
MLVFIKTLHTVIWAVFAAGITALPFVAWQGKLVPASFIIAAVFFEIFILFRNKWSCPLTPWARRYTEDRSPNFDIYLPAWLAQWNKWIFSGIFLIGFFLTLWRWQVG